MGRTPSWVRCPSSCAICAAIMTAAHFALLEGPRRSPDSRLQSGYALLASRIRRHFLIQIDRQPGELEARRKRVPPGLWEKRAVASALSSATSATAGTSAAWTSIPASAMTASSPHGPPPFSLPCRLTAKHRPAGPGSRRFSYVSTENVRPLLNRLRISSQAWGARRSVPGLDARDHGPAVEFYFALHYFTCPQ